MGSADRDQVPGTTTSVSALPQGSASDGLAVVATGLSHDYDGPSGKVPVLRDLTMTIPQDGYAALVGPSGFR
jgi:ABC-type transport system involved in cytochrome bd biosynthesis fused ATPase/permease subunit